VAFKSGFSGAKNVYAEVSDGAGCDSGWQQKGTWTTP
jgi:hypothetical protein